MNIVLFTHPEYLGSQSMPRYAKMVSDGMKERGHSVEIWSPSGVFLKFSFWKPVRKWMGYLNQFIVFPATVKKKLRACSSETLFVFVDQALGPWVYLVKDRPHVVHCHDFLAQRSALGEIPENKVGLSGKIYQWFIRRGYRKGRNFISVSNKTKNDLHKFLEHVPKCSKVIYNGLNQDFNPGNVESARRVLDNAVKISHRDGYILHVGGNQFYKNRKGVIQLYTAWRENNKKELPLILIGPEPTPEIQKMKESSGFSQDIYFLKNVSDDLLKIYYQGATVLLFPSLEEGFGWPIAEAMASGCPVITTGKAPMNEVGGKSCFYLESFAAKEQSPTEWARDGAEILQRLIGLPPSEKERLVKAGIENAKKFDTNKAIEEIETIYQEVLKEYRKENSARAFLVT